MLDGPADADLVARISHDDAEAFRECYQRHSEAVYNVALRILGGPAQAADLTQEVFLTLHQRSREIQQADRLGGWLLRIAVNLSIDWWRKGKGDPVSLDGVAHLVQDPAGRNPVDRLMDWEEEQRLSRAILELSIGEEVSIECLRDRGRVPLVDPGWYRCTDAYVLR